MKHSFSVWFVLLFCALTNLYAQQQGLIARYPLNSNPNDTTGNHGPMTLINTPFQDSGIYCNGRYIYGDTNYCHAITPQLADFSFQAFSIRARFKVLETYNYPRPVFVGGDSYRWVAFNLNPDGTVSFLYNNNNTLNSNVQYVLNTWHEATITYDSAAGTGKFYLDTILVDSVQFQLIHGNDRNIGITNFSNTAVFKGIFSDLRIYSTVVIPTEVRGTWAALPEKFKLYQNYPNPFNPSTTIRFTLSRSAFITLKVLNILGQEVAKLTNEDMIPGGYSVTFNAIGLTSGVYFYQLQAGSFTESRKLVLLR